MPNNFNKWKFIYDAEDLIPFTENKEALLWLKVKSVVRKEIINEFQKGKDINNEFLKEIINRIEVYSNNQINIIFNL